MRVSIPRGGFCFCRTQAVADSLARPLNEASQSPEGVFVFVGRLEIARGNKEFVSIPRGGFCFCREDIMTQFFSAAGLNPPRGFLFL